MPDLVDDIHESPNEMTGPLVLLASLSVFIFYTLPRFNPFSDHGWFTDLIVPQTAVVPGSMTAHQITEYSHHAHDLAMGLSIAVEVIGISLSVLVYLKKIIPAETLAKKMGFLYDWSLNKFYVDENYHRFLYKPFLNLSSKVAWIDWELYDRYFINGFGLVTEWFSRVIGKFDYDGIDQGLVDGIGRMAGVTGHSLRKIQTGRLQNYLLFVVAGVIVMIIVQAF